jgi:hypothetical protein
MKRVLFMIIGSAISLSFAVVTSAADSTDERPYFAVCKAQMASDHALHLKMAKNADNQFWTVTTREYNPETGETYVSDDAQDAKVLIDGKSFSIRFNESALRADATAMNEPCFKAALVQDGDPVIEMSCNPYGVRVFCRNLDSGRMPRPRP